MDDLSVTLSRANAGCYVNDICVNHLFYADDICLLAPSAIGLQRMIDICTDYGIENDILFNSLKSNCLTVLPRRYSLNVPSITLNDSPLNNLPSVKYLGVSINQSLDDNDDISRQLRSLYASGNSILHNFSMCSVGVKLQLLESYCLNFYCSVLWCKYSTKVFNKIRVAYHNVIRKTFRLS